MDRWWSDGTERGGVLWGGVIAIVAAGALLGIAQNVLVRMGSADAGVAWKYEPPRVLTVEEAMKAAQNGGAPPPAAGTSSGYGASPFMGAGNVPIAQIPDLGQPLEVTVTQVREAVDTNTITIIDAREPVEFAAGHIPGAVNMPFDTSISDPVLLESFDAQGKPIVVYCGGHTCELSMKLGHALVAAGKTRVFVYTGGWPEWSEMKYPVEQGAKPEGA